jgi:dTDP-4-amino-4,6-dideoxygalactose transaminase
MDVFTWANVWANDNRHMTTSLALALLGGSPVRTRPFTRWPIWNRRDEQRLVRAVRSGHWGKLTGAEVATFERRFASLHGCRHGIGMVNGTVSLRLGLIAAGLQPGDEVIVPPYTFYATASAVLEANAIPVFADIDLKTFNLDPAAAAAAVTRRTRAIIPVHFAGQPADMDAFRRLGRKHGLVILEDAAHAHGATWRDRPAGSLGHLASFSFQSSKNLTAGEGGIITTNDATLAERCVSLHNCGRIPTGAWYEHHVLAGNYRLGEFQGAILNSQLDRLAEQTKRRDRNGRRLAGRLHDIPGLHVQARPAACTRHSYHLFMLRVVPEEFGAPRAALIEALRAEGIPCSGGYPISLHRQPMFRDKAFGPYLPQARQGLDYRKVHCPNSDRICEEQGLWLEQSIFLGPAGDIDDIAEAFGKIHAQRTALATWARRRKK